jgi:hypothetical protein
LEVSKQSQKNVNVASEPYKVDLDTLNPHPGFATTIFVSWDDLSDYFGLFEDWDIYKEGEETPEEFVEVAFTEARNWAKLFKAAPSEGDIVAKENAIIASLQDHWSSSNIFLSKFSFDQLVSDLNDWSHLGAREPHLFGNVPDPGKSLEFFMTDLGISFTVYKPFMIPYTEIYYHLYSGLPEWNYGEIEGIDIIETLFAVQDKKGLDTEIDLSDWASKWRFDDEHPTVHIEPEMEDYFAEEE